MRVIAVPAALEERHVDSLFQQCAEVSPGERVLVDARRVRWVEPYGMLALLAAGVTLGADRELPRLELPESTDVVGYLNRMLFFEHARRVFEMERVPRRSRDASSDVLLEITAVRSHTDVHGVVDRVQDRAGAILTRQLGYPLSAAVQFSVILSEVCQNVVEHAQATGWVAAQTYGRTPRLERKVVKIAVADLGIGFRGSLSAEHAARFGDRWGDAAALEAAFIHGLTRFHDPGRGQGLQQIRKQVGRWGGKISIRSGTARIADVPDWDDAAPLEEQLAAFRGSQIGIELPQLQATITGANGGKP
ncbi:MAG: ATP-binding protein [Longimicrobiales bacterium]